jgi:hypothetical protein
VADRADTPSSSPRSPDATEDNAFWPVAITTGAWLVAGLVLLLMGAQLSQDRQWWIATCAVGVISGLGGMIYIKRRAGRGRRAAARQARKAIGDGTQQVGPD